MSRTPRSKIPVPELIKILVGKSIPVLGTETLSEDVGEASTLEVGVSVGVRALKGVGVAVGRLVGRGVGEICFPDGVAVKEGRLLSPVAKTTKDRLTVFKRPFLSV